MLQYIQYIHMHVSLVVVCDSATNQIKHPTHEYVLNSAKHLKRNRGETLSQPRRIHLFIHLKLLKHKHAHLQVLEIF